MRSLSADTLSNRETVRRRRMKPSHRGSAEVLQLVAEGNTNAQIAARLHLSQRTVEDHRATLMQRLGLQNQAELIRHAMRRGLISPEE